MKDRIISEALRLFSQSGYDSTGINQIVQECRVTKPTLYYYFKSKEKLLEAIVSRYCTELREALRASFNPGADTAGKLYGIADAYLVFASKNRDFIRLYLSLVFTPHSNKSYHAVKAEAEQIQMTVESMFEGDSCFTNNRSFFVSSFIGQMNMFSTLILNGYVEYSKKMSGAIAMLFLNGAGSFTDGLQ